MKIISKVKFTTFIAFLVLTSCGDESALPINTPAPNSPETNISSDDNSTMGEINEPSADMDDPSDQTDLPSLPITPFNYADIPLPDHYLINGFNPRPPLHFAAIESDNTPQGNPITDEGATLGRVLFYDQKLSANGTIACASCHSQENGFSDPRQLSEGFSGLPTRRHSMSLANARFYFSGRFFWDERASSLEEQVLQPFQDPVEMGLTLEQLETIVNSQSYYEPLFEAAFGDSNISSDRIALALSQFIRSMVNSNSKYDEQRSTVNSPMAPFPGFTDLENLGKDLFFFPRRLTNGGNGSCANCHSSEAFVGSSPNNRNMNNAASNNGLDAMSSIDLGLFETTDNPNDIGKFKTPSLANIGATAPYMHDGRFSTLEDVVEHYSSGINNHPNLSPPFRGRNRQIGQFNFSEEEKAALVAFMNTLTDDQLLSDERFSNPFN